MEVGLSGGVMSLGEPAKTGLLPADMRSHQKCLIRKGTRAGLGLGRPSSSMVVAMAVGRHLRKQLNSR